MDGSNFISWLHKNYVADENQETVVGTIIQNIQTQFGDKFQGCRAIGKYITTAFPSVRKVKVRDPNDWLKRINLYKGLGERVKEVDEALLTITDINKIIPHDFFVLTQDDTKITLGKTTSEKCNDNMVIIKLVISNDGKVDIQIGNKSVTSQSGISNSVILKKCEIQSLFSSVSSVRLCQGVPYDLSKENQENIYVQKNKEDKLVMMSMSCQKVLNFNSLKTTTGCQNCRSIMLTKDKIRVDDTSTNMSTDEINRVPPIKPTFTSEDVISILKDKAPYLSNNQLKLIESQISNSKNKQTRRWDSSIIQLSLSMWTRSPKTYEQLVQNGSLVLPSTRTLSRYKNAVEQGPGINHDAFRWMYLQAQHEELPTHGYYGGLILDEMSIQEDLQIVKRNGNIKLIGLTEETSIDTGLANHVLQFVFHGLTGFRFPIAHYPTKQANAAQLYSSFWDVIAKLEQWNFKVLYCSIDGASNNRTFVKMHFTGTPVESHMAAFNPCGDEPVVFIADPSHLFKKIRNNILKSGNNAWHTRELLVDGLPVLWKMWEDSYTWDKQHSLSIHHKLSNEHIHPNQAEKMRNHLAEEVLDDNMLNLMRQYQSHLGDKGAILQGALSLLEQTSELIKIFHDRRPITSESDIRIIKLRRIHTWFSAWEKHGSTRSLMSWETREDVAFLIVGFLKLVSVATKSLRVNVTPLYINSDIVENLFSQQRGLYHGAGANPNYSQYSSATNSIILSQTIVSDKSNAARRKSSSTPAALSFPQLCKKSRI